MKRRPIRLKSADRNRIPLVFSLLVLLAVSAIRPLNEPTIADGEWSGTYSIQGTIPSDNGQTWTGSYSGTMHFTSQAGELDGNFTLTGAADIAMPEVNGTVTATTDGEGVISGTSNLPEMKATRVTTNATLTSSGGSMTQSFEAGKESLQGVIQVTLISATCSQAIGDIAGQFAQLFKAETGGGASDELTGSWVATRVGDIDPAKVQEYNEAVSALLQQAEAFKQQQFSSIAVDFDALDELLEKAENEQRAIRRNEDCGFGSGAQYMLTITDVVADLVRFALENSDKFSTADLGRLANAAVRVGAMGSGSVDTGLSAELTQRFTAIFNQRLDNAIENNDCNDVRGVTIAAATIGNSELGQRAKNAVDPVCGQIK